MFSRCSRCGAFLSCKQQHHKGQDIGQHLYQLRRNVDTLQPELEALGKSVHQSSQSHPQRLLASWSARTHRSDPRCLQLQGPYGRQAAAEALGISKAALYRKIQEYRRDGA